MLHLRRASGGWAVLIRVEGYSFVPNSRQDPAFRVAADQAHADDTARTRT